MQKQSFETDVGMHRDWFEPSRQSFLKTAALAGAAVSITSSFARAVGESGYWAKDLTDEQLVGMLTTIERIRWHERTMADKMLTDSSYRATTTSTPVRRPSQRAYAPHSATLAPSTRSISSIRRAGPPGTRSPRVST